MYFLRSGRAVYFSQHSGLFQPRPAYIGPICQLISKITDTLMRFVQELADNIQPELFVAFWG